MRRKRTLKQGSNDQENSEPHDRASHAEGSSDHVQPIDLDQERRERMQRNERILQELGLSTLMRSMDSAAAEAKATAPKKRQAVTGEDRVLRRSLRTRGQEPELPPLLVPLFGRPAAEQPYQEPVAKPRAAAAATTGGDGASKFDAHNLHRLRTMSDDAMMKRIHKITNTLKLKSLVQLLREFGREELAEEAQAALDARLANV